MARTKDRPMPRAFAAVVLLALLALLAPIAHADTIALLPLDADKRLEIYGQPVAAELGRALKAAGLDVVVVGDKATVPESAQLIVDGSIKKAGKNEVTLSLRIRDPKGGTVLETLPSSTTPLTTIDKAAAELSAKIVPAVRAQLAAIAAAKKPELAPPGPPAPRGTQTPPTVPVTPTGPAVAPAVPMIAVNVAALHDSPVVSLLTSALRDEAMVWAKAHASPAAAGHAIELEVLGVDVDPGDVPMAQARARARITDGQLLVFDRVIVTDTIVGDRHISDRDMAVRTAREVLAVANAQLRRIAKGWR